MSEVIANIALRAVCAVPAAISIAAFVQGAFTNGAPAWFTKVVVALCTM